MKKHKFIAFLLIVALLLAAVPGALLAQDTTEEVDVVAEVVEPRLVELNENLPEGYGVINVDAFLELLVENEDVVILDVREAGELEEFGVIEDSIHIPTRTIGPETLGFLPDLDATIVVVCKGGLRATIAAVALWTLGYENTKILGGGFDAWVGEDLPVVDAAAEAELGDVPEDIDPLLMEYVGEYMANLPDGWGAIGPVELFEETFEGSPEFLFDVRSEEEWADPGYIEGATNIWINEFMANSDQFPEELDADIVVYCKAGYRAGIGSTFLGLLGYENVRSLPSGTNGWLAADLPLVQPES